MDYHRIYNEIIANAKSRNKVSEKTERHHIIPRSLGGGDEAYNLVDLTLREHYIAHLLLFKLAKNKNEKIRMFQPIKLMVKVLENSDVFNSRKFKAIKELYYENHQMQLEEVRANVSKGVKAAYVQRGCKEVLCACGCSSVVSLSTKSVPPRKYLKGHFSRDIKDRTPVNFGCACGCGRIGITSAFKIKDANYIHGHYRPARKALAEAHKRRLSKFTKHELAERMKNTLWKADKVLRAEAIREGKSSLLKVVYDNGTEIVFKSTQVPPELNMEYSKIKYLIRRYNGRDPNNSTVRFEFVKKYEGGNKWKK